jgi:hypothetical protein
MSLFENSSGFNSFFQLIVGHFFYRLAMFLLCAPSVFCVASIGRRPAVGDPADPPSRSIPATPSATADAAWDRTLTLLYALSGVFALLIFALAGLCITQRVSRWQNQGVSMEPLVPDQGGTEPPVPAAANGAES